MKNMLQILPSELLDKLIEYVNNKTTLSMSSKKMREFFNKKNKVFVDKLVGFWIQKNKKKMSNIMTNFQYQKYDDSTELIEKQSDVRQSFSSQLEDVRHSTVIQQLLSDEILDDKRDAIKKLLDEHADASKTLHCKQMKDQRLFDRKQSQILWEFYIKQRESFTKFDIEVSQPEAIEIFLSQQIDAIKKLQSVQLTALCKLQSEQTTALWELQIKQNNALISLPDTSYDQRMAIKNLIDAIKNIQSIQDNNIRKLQFEHMKATRELQINQLRDTHEHNFKHVKCSKLMQPKEVEASFKYMKEYIKTIIHKKRQKNNMKKLTQNEFVWAMYKIGRKKLDDNEYSRYIDDEDYEYIIDYKIVYIIKIIIFLYLTKESHFELDFDQIRYYGIINYFYTDNSWLIEDRFIDYFKIVFPTLNNITTLKIFNENCENLSLSLKLFELILLLPALQSFMLKFIPTILDFELPDQKLKITNLEIEVDEHDDDKYYNIHKIVEMCPYINKLQLFEDGQNSNIDNKYLVELGKKLKECNKLTALRISTGQKYGEEELDFIPLLSECPNLTKLELWAGCMKNNAAINIARLVSIRTTFTHLDLSYNYISSGIEIAKILSGHISLSHLNLTDNEFGDEEIEKIREILSHNQTLKELLL
jgi:hypothetical protein